MNIKNMHILSIMFFPLFVCAADNRPVDNQTLKLATFSDLAKAENFERLQEGKKVVFSKHEIFDTRENLTISVDKIIKVPVVIPCNIGDPISTYDTALAIFSGKKESPVDTKKKAKTSTYLQIVMKLGILQSAQVSPGNKEVSWKPEIIVPTRATVPTLSGPLTSHGHVLELPFIASMLGADITIQRANGSKYVYNFFNESFNPQTITLQGKRFKPLPEKTSWWRHNVWQVTPCVTMVSSRAESRINDNDYTTSKTVIVTKRKSKENSYLDWQFTKTAWLAAATVSTVAAVYGYTWLRGSKP